MSYDPDLWRRPDDIVWALKETAQPSGFMPNATSTVEFLQVLESDGLVHRSNTAPVWFITDAGRHELSKLGH